MSLLKAAMEKIAGRGTSKAAQRRREEANRGKHYHGVAGEIIQTSNGAVYEVQRNGSWKRVK